MRIGIDIGGSLTKIVYEHEDEHECRIVTDTRVEEIVSHLEDFPGAAVFATGCGAALLEKRLRSKVTIANELESFCEGARFFLNLGGGFHPCILVSFGTGTSVFYLAHNEGKRVTGTAVGGGTITGLGGLLAGTSDFEALMNLAVRGDRRRVDLMVSDLYPETDLSPVATSLTAANFGGRRILKATREDLASAIIQLVTETIALISIQTARTYGVERVIIAGSPSRHDLVRKRFSEIGMMLGQSFVFLEEGPYCGAMGAILWGSKREGGF